MKAAVVYGPGQTPQYADFPNPTPSAGEELITVHASALSHFTKGRASGSHYSSDGVFPAVVGADGVGTTSDGRRVYFVLPEAPNGAMAERTVVRSRQCIELPPDIDDITAAAIANPGMSAWAALVERAHLQPGETVLINGATGTAGRLAVQLAKYLGASKVIATARDANALEDLRALGADVLIPFDLEPVNPQGRRQYEAALKEQFALGINVVIDYLWGVSAETIIVAIAKAIDDATPVRFVHVGGLSGGEIQLPGAALRSSAIVLMGSGNKSVPMPRLLAAIQSVFDAFIPAQLQINPKVVPLSQVKAAWDDIGKPRIVFVP
ncbi:zinc-binding dehydrogenase [Granulicella sp. 5B5]|uniref:quinone oxidoreductase family protein n=1 Tax=Granulicella sp. 5B5 TaxID=1617967 RepID=UPI0015F75BA6|nr:zinc-binding alcohol dehydrogenase family protein [Granulicella sp. 5B5]QMV19945.1 zinc-binding dehydrogenase [Granulicella sp. 5B5]